MYYTYILQSLSTGRYYFGSTSDTDKRLKYHNSGKVRSTKAYRPWKIIYTEEYTSKTEAIQREHFFKSIDGYNWLNAAVLRRRSPFGIPKGSLREKPLRMQVLLGFESLSLRFFNKKPRILRI